jgi:glycosyltransferase involved in cell wall biosynthesis
MNEEMSEHTRLIKKLATENNLIDKIIFLDQILEEFSIPKEKSRDVVRDLYFVSHLVMLLSIDEGFGLPILEAGVARTPLAVVQIPVFREVAKGGALYLPLDESENYNAKRVIEFLNKNNTEREALFHSTLNRYNWDNLWDDYLKEFFNR